MRSLPLLGNLLEFRRDMLGFLRRVAEDQGDVARFRLVGRDVVLLSDPELIRDVLVTRQREFVNGPGLERARALLGDGMLTSEGDAYRRGRRLAQPAFHRQRLTEYARVMTDACAETEAEWRDGARVDVYRDMLRLTLKVVSRSLFAADLERDAEAMSQAVAVVQEWFWGYMMPLAGLRARLPLPSTLRFRRAEKRLDAIIGRVVRERRADASDRGDLLSMLLLARDVEGAGEGHTDAQLRDEVLTIFLAGHETVADALAWTWHLLSRHPDALARLHAELDGVLAGRAPGPEDLWRLPFTRMVLAESLRLFPPAWVIARRPVRDLVLGGQAVAAGTVVFVSQWVTHHDTRFFPEPFAFQPERWTPEAEAARPKFSYFPFGGGPRQCVGEHFAWMEGMLVLATLAQRWTLASGADPVLDPGITLRPRHGLPMTLRRRRPAPLMTRTPSAKSR